MNIMLFKCKTILIMVLLYLLILKNQYKITLKFNLYNKVDYLKYYCGTCSKKYGEDNLMINYKYRSLNDQIINHYKTNQFNKSLFI